MRCRTIGTAATRIAQLAELIDRSEVIGLLFRMLDQCQMVDQCTCRHDLSGWAQNSTTDTICQFLCITAMIAKLLPESWDCMVHSVSSALAALNMQQCDLGDGSAFSPNLCHETVSHLFSMGKCTGKCTDLGGGLPIGEVETAHREFLCMDDIRCVYACGF